MNVSHKNSREIGRINSDVPKSLIRKFPAEIESYKIPNSDERTIESSGAAGCVGQDVLHLEIEWLQRNEAEMERQLKKRLEASGGNNQNESVEPTN
jgi:hypothetical protein